ncbi:5740_t:CDS:2, partial [Dentiscutata heterogama]
IAIEGCCHNQLELIYKTIDYIEKEKNIRVDLLLICGDVQTIRNRTDLDSTSMPDHYKEMGTFYKYYSGELKAPIPTIFIGGNHEASNYLWELYYGGWVCENIYYLGCSGVVNFGGLRIGGLSGIYKQRDYGLGHFETFPYTDDTIRSIYHVRRYEMFKLNMIRQPIDIILSHDWPENITRFGDEKRLKQIKKGLAPDIERIRLGNPYCELLLYKLKPRYWFAAHLHVKFAALIPHDVPQTVTAPNPDEIPISLDEIPISLDEVVTDQNEVDDPDPDELPSFIDDIDNADEIQIIDSEETPIANDITAELPLNLEDLEEFVASSIPSSIPSNTRSSYTRFLSLDKCLPGREFLQILDFPEANGPLEFSYDEEWLAITKATHQFFSVTYKQVPLPTESQMQDPLDTSQEWVRNNILQRDSGLLIPKNFLPTAPAHNSSNQQEYNLSIPFLNPQTVAFTQMLEIENKINPDGQT